MRIRIQLNKICNKDKKDCSKVKKTGIELNLLTITTNFLAFFLFFSSSHFSLLDPDPGRKRPCLFVYITLITYSIQHMMSGYTYILPQYIGSFYTSSDQNDLFLYTGSYY